MTFIFQTFQHDRPLHQRLIGQRVQKRRFLHHQIQARVGGSPAGGSEPAEQCIRRQRDQLGQQWPHRDHKRDQRVKRNVHGQQ